MYFRILNLKIVQSIIIINKLMKVLINYYQKLQYEVEVGVGLLE